MPPMVADGVLAALILGMTYALMSEGLWGAALMFFNVLFGAMIALNFYEPLAAMLDSLKIGWGMSDTLCLLLLFGVSTLLLRLTTESLAPAMVRFPAPVYHAGRVFFGLAASIVTVAVIALAYECAPVHKKFMSYKQEPPFHMGVDHKFLAFFQYSTGQIFTSKSETGDPFRQYGPVKVFDPRGEWLLNHQDARPYGDAADSVLGGEEGGAAADAAAGAPGGAAQPKGMPMPGTAPPGAGNATPERTNMPGGIAPPGGLKAP